MATRLIWRDLSAIILFAPAKSFPAYRNYTIPFCIQKCLCSVATWLFLRCLGYFCLQCNAVSGYTVSHLPVSIYVTNFFNEKNFFFFLQMANYLCRSTPLKVGPKVRTRPQSDFECWCTDFLQWASFWSPWLAKYFPDYAITLELWIVVPNTTNEQQFPCRHLWGQVLKYHRLI